MNLETLKYVELQRLAKQAGLKANVKAEKLLEVLKEHFSQGSENGNDPVSVDAHDTKPVNAHASTFVTERRRKDRAAKRKTIDPSPAVPSQTEESPSQKESLKGSKRRKVSSTKENETPVEALANENILEKEPESGEPTPDSEIPLAEPHKKDVGRRPAGKIPRHERLMKRKNTLRPSTPNFKKLHEAHFKKMESIDTYVQRKNKQMEEFRESVKELKTLSEKIVMKPTEIEKAPRSRASLFTPGGQKPAVAESPRVTKQSANKSFLKDTSSFKPTIHTVNKINVRFSKTTHDNEYKRSLVKTPARMSPHVPLTSTPGRKSDVPKRTELNKSIGTINKMPGVTPFLFSGNNSMSGTPGTTKKNAFDLKASLSRPLNYKPHKGKLKPYGDAQESTALNKSQIIPSHQKNYKQHQVETREERRAKQAEERKQKKDKMLGARRGLVLT